MIGDARHGIALDTVTPPQGRRPISSTLRITRRSNINAAGTTLLWQGPSNEPCVEFVGGAKSRIDGLWVEGACAAGFRLSATGVGNITNVRLRDCEVSDAAIGYHVALNGDTSKDVKNDFHVFDNCRAQDYTDAAFVIEGWNAKQIKLRDVLCQGNGTGQYGIDTARVAYRGGSFHATNPFFSGNTVCDIRVRTQNDTLRVDGGYSQQGVRFLQVLPVETGFPPIAAGTPRAKSRWCITITSFRWATEGSNLPPDGEIVQCYGPGPLTMIGCEFGGPTATGNLRFRFEPKDDLGVSLPGSWKFENCVIASENTDWFPARQPDSVAGSFWQDPNGAMTPIAQWLV